MSRRAQPKYSESMARAIAERHAQFTAEAEARRKLEAAAEQLAALLEEIWASIPATHHLNDPFVQRHAAALNRIPEALRAAGRLP